jgi:2-(1,2-epoxy-1,2-dihydrophenyl)acetyl-CoA isomerase
MDEQTSTVTCDIRGQVAHVALVTPALTVKCKSHLVRALTEVGSDDEVRAVVLTGAGKAFCVGQDLSEHAAALEDGALVAFETLQDHYEPIIAALIGMPKPVIAAINGACVGAGLSIALACDVRVARAGAVFGTAFTAIGLSFDSGLSASLARAVGYARASELMMLGETFTAEQAREWGLVGRVVEAPSFQDEVEAMALRLASGPTQAYVAAKRALAMSWAAPLAVVLASERAAQIALGGSADHRGAVAAFLNKEKPTFTGRF